MTTPLISPSILNCDIARLEDELKKISSADIAHVDVMDNHFVPNLTWGLPVVEACVNTGILPIDAHLMIEDPVGRLRTQKPVVRRSPSMPRPHPHRSAPLGKSDVWVPVLLLRSNLRRTSRPTSIFCRNST